MTAPPGWRTIHGLILLADPRNPDMIWYAPAAPDAERDPAGRPAVTLILAGSTRLLTLGAVLSAPDPAVDAARTLIRGEKQVDVTLKPSPATVTSAQVFWVRAPEDRVVLGSSPTSGYPPFNSVFSMSLDEQSAAAAAAALAGGLGHLFVAYKITLAVPGTAAVEAALDADVGSWFTGPGLHPIVIG